MVDQSQDGLDYVQNWLVLAAQHWFVLAAIAFALAAIALSALALIAGFSALHQVLHLVFLWLSVIL